MNKQELVKIITKDLDVYRERLDRTNGEILEYSTPDDLLDLSRDWSIYSTVVNELEWVLSQVDMLDENKEECHGKM